MKHVYPLARERGAVLLAKGHSFDAPEDDLPALLNRVAASTSPPIPLVGVALKVAVKYPGAQSEVHSAEPLEADYSDYVLVPGLNEEANSTWRSKIAREIRKIKNRAGQWQPGITLVFGGAATTWVDVIDSIEQQCYVIAITSPNELGICNKIGRGLRTGHIEQVDWLGSRVKEMLPQLLTSSYLHAYPYHDFSKIAAFIQYALT